MWRTADAVRDMWDHYRERFQFWEPYRWEDSDGTVYDGHRLMRKLPAGLEDPGLMYVRDVSRKAVTRGHVEAFRLLSGLASGGHWSASGRPTYGEPQRGNPLQNGSTYMSTALALPTCSGHLPTLPSPIRKGQPNALTTAVILPFYAIETAVSSAMMTFIFRLRGCSYHFHRLR
jgi:hypothetical protein